VYEEFIEELRYNLTEDNKEPVPVFPFPYDWRQPLKLIEKELERFIDEVIERTKLLPHYHKDGYGKQPKVNLVGHSMGGLIIAGYIATSGSGKVHKVASLGAPFQGSPEAIRKIATGEPRSREREVARIIPALYHLLPTYKRAVCAAGDLSNDLLAFQSWQPSIIDTLAKFISKGGLPSCESPMDRANQLLQRMLCEAREYRNKFNGLSYRTSGGFSSKNWLCIVGVGEETLLSVHIRKIEGKLRFDFQTNKTNQGDGTVPYLGARWDFIPKNEVVCVSSKDIEEVDDHALMALIKWFGDRSGLHSILPEMSLVQRLVISHFKGAEHGDVWGRCAPDLSDSDNWDPPISGLDLRQ
jgi:hypothetical protein